MAASILDTEHERELLLHAIVTEVESWPQLHRKIFSGAHYRGEPAERIAESLGVGQDTVRTILRDCERRLRSALRSFRTDALEPMQFVPKCAANRCL